MKKVLLTLLAVFTLTALSAQPNGIHHNNPGSAPQHLATPSIIVESHHGETFFVYLNGDLMNNVPKTQVVVDKLNNQIQDIIVVLNHPAHKAGIIQAFASVEGTRVSVSYDPRDHRMFLYTDRQNGAAGTSGYGTPSTPSTPTTPPASGGTTIVKPANPAKLTVSDAWVDEMIGLINQQSFENEKLSTAKGLLSNKLPFTSDQIARIAGALKFGTAQVDFLKAAYTRCYDRDNYERAIAVLTFASDRKKVRTYIESLR